MKEHKTALFQQIERLESMSKRGESYATDSGRYGWRNPIRQDTGPLLSDFVSSHDPIRILEVGTAHGLSALHLVSGWSSPKGRELDTIELDSAVRRQAQEMFDGLGLPVRVHTGEAMDVISQSLSGRYDLVFLDAQKSHYGRQWRALAQRGLVGSGTMLLADNVIDRKSECEELFDALEEQGLAYEIIPTECGLLKAVLP